MGWLAGWSFRKRVTVTGQGGAGSLYQVELSIGDSAGGDLHLEDHCDNFPQDIQITDNDGVTPLDYWVEDLTADPLLMWVEIADNLDDNIDIYVYYNKSGENSASDGDASFEFFDDFLGDSLDNDKWNLYGDASFSIEDSLLKITASSTTYKGVTSVNTYNLIDKAVRWKDRVDVDAFAGDYERTEMAILNGTFYYRFIWEHKYDDLIYVEVALAAETEGGHPRPDNVFCYLNAIAKSEATRFWRDDDFDYTHTGVEDEPTDAHIRWFAYRSNADLDWIFIRKYVSPEPAFLSAGDEETEEAPPAVGIPSSMNINRLVGGAFA